MTPANVTPPQAKDLIVSKGHIYLDVRTVSEYEAGHPSGAYNVPVYESEPSGKMVENPAFLPVVEAHFPKETPIVVGCRSGGRSLVAAKMLKDAGFTNVSNMVGGYGGGESATGEDVRGWAACGYPIDRDSGAARGYGRLKVVGSE